MLSLFGCFLTKRPYNQRATKELFRSLWKFGIDLRIVDVGDGLFQFKFTLESQLKWVLNNGPWSFDNHPLVLRRWERGMTANSITFTVLPIWVQIWGLPFDLISEEAARDIGRSLGQVVEIDHKAFTSKQAMFIKIRVEIAIDKTLHRGGFVVNPKGYKVRIGFRYERLVGLRFQCGYLGHEARDCSTPRCSIQSEFPYGDWLKAGLRKSGDRSIGRKKSLPLCEPPPSEANGFKLQT
ncbi:hypothetical protein SO802_008245 [Lithocarpus litseifolius]|uniref:CCHC-type domain-containing protein n=1 Tax=Lithocarpus litseifolius TaxID=425828 RepID=A0AAW2DAT1_9ROSI